MRTNHPQANPVNHISVRIYSHKVKTNTLLILMSQKSDIVIITSEQ